MSGLFGGGGSKVTTYSGIPLQTTDATSVVPILYGQNRLSATCIWYANFTSEDAGSKAGGKGGLFGGSGETVYKADVAMAICQGLVTGIPVVYQTSYTALTLSDVDLGFYEGSYPQTAWSVTGETLGYTGISYVYAQQWDLGPAASIGNNSFVPQGVLVSTGYNHAADSTDNDADPALVIQDFLTNTYYGVGFPSASLVSSGAAGALTGSSGDSSLQTWCWAAGLAFSPVLNRPEAANTTIDRWLKLLGATAVWSGGRLSFIPRATESLYGSGRTFVPVSTVQYVLSDDDFVGGKDDDPVVCSLADPYSLDNIVILEICSRGDDWNTGPIQAFNQVAIQKFGQRVGSSIEAHEFTNLGDAQTSAQLILQRGLYVRQTFKFKLGLEFCLLDPMDIVEINDTYLGLVNFRVRIQSIEEDEDGLLAFTAEEMPFGVAAPVSYPVQANLASSPDAMAVPNPVNTPIIFTPASHLTDGGVDQVWIAVSPTGGDPNWGSCLVNVSLDGSTGSYAYYGRIYGKSTMGVLTAALATYSGANPDTTDTISVNLAESLGTLPATFGAGAASAGVSACLIGSEYISYETASNPSANNFVLSTLYRGQFGSTQAAASIGASFIYIGGNIGKFSIPGAVSGQTAWFKFQSENIFGGAVQSLASCTPYSFTFP